MSLWRFNPVFQCACGCATAPGIPMLINFVSPCDFCPFSDVGTYSVIDKKGNVVVSGTITIEPALGGFLTNGTAISISGIKLQGHEYPITINFDITCSSPISVNVPEPVSSLVVNIPFVPANCPPRGVNINVGVCSTQGRFPTTTIIPAPTEATVSIPEWGVNLNITPDVNGSLNINTQTAMVTGPATVIIGADGFLTSTCSYDFECRFGNTLPIGFTHDCSAGVIFGQTLVPETARISSISGATLSISGNYTGSCQCSAQVFTDPNNALANDPNNYPHCDMSISYDGITCPVGSFTLTGTHPYVVQPIVISEAGEPTCNMSISFRDSNSNPLGTPIAGYIWLGFCDCPIKSTLHWSDHAGNTATLTWNGSVYTGTANTVPPATVTWPTSFTFSQFVTWEMITYPSFFYQSLNMPGGIATVTITE
jgi:hypothetical protein